MKSLTAISMLALALIAAPAQSADPLERLVRLLAASNDALFQLDVLRGISDALKGHRSVSMPSGWETVETKLTSSTKVEVRTLAETISLTFGSKHALTALRSTLADSRAPMASRRAALDALAGIHDTELPVTLQALLKEAPLRPFALRALGGYNDPKTPEAIFAVYASLDAAQKRDALNTLAARSIYAKPLLAAIDMGKLPKQDLTADLVRQLRNVKDPDFQQQVARLFGTAREISADKQSEIKRYRGIYGAGGSQPGDGPRGRVVFNKVCAQCHTLFDSGGKVGPELTGANRGDINYLLENMLDPNAVIPNEYRASDIETKDGRNITGIIKRQDDKTLVVQAANELITLPRNEITAQRQSELSMMPEGLLAPLTDQEVRDLIYYLTRVGQVPLAAEKAK